MRAITKIAVLLLLWLAPTWMTAQGLLRSELCCRRYTTHDGLPQMQCEKVWQDSRGYIYVGTLSGFARFDGRSLTPFLRGRRWNIVGFMEHDGQVEAMDFRRRWLINGTEVEQHPLTTVGGWLLNNLNAGDLPDGYLLLEDEQEEHRHLCRVVPDGALDTLCALPLLDQMLPDRKLYMDGSTLYIPTPQGLFVRRCADNEKRIMNNDNCRLLSEKSDVYSLCRADSVLYAFADDGIYQVDVPAQEGVGSYSLRLVATAPEGFAPDYGVTARPIDGGCIIMADGHSIYTFDGDTICRVAGGFNLIRGLFVDSWHRLWVASYQGLYCYFGRQFTNHWLLDENDLVRTVAFDGDGRLVMGTLNGKLLIDGAVAYDNADDFFQPSSVVIDGAVYLAGRQDVARVAPDGLSWLGLDYSRCQFLAEADGRLVVGMRQALLRYDPESGAIDTLSKEIAHPWGAAMDRNGDLWVGSTFGLYRVQAGQTTKVDYEGRSLVVTTMDGVPLSQASLGGTICLASQDSLFLIRHGRVSCLNPQLPQLNGHEVKSVHISPRGYLAVAVIDGLLVCQLDEDCRVEDAAFFDHHDGFTLIEPQKATMAEEADGMVWTAGLEAVTSFLPERLLKSSHEDTYIAPPPTWWQRWWWLAALVAVALLIWLVTLFERLRHRRKMVRLQRAKKQKELQISAIRLKAIPHFHSNVLAAIEYFMMNNSADEATHYLKLYSDFTNQTLCDIDRPARTLAEELDYVRIYLQLEQLRYGDRLEYDIQVAGDVNRQALLPTMLIYTYSQNAVKHGLASKPEGGRVEIVATRGDHAVVIQVIDNGVGRTAAASLNQNSTKQGLRILEEQIALYNQTNSRPIRQRVTDLYDEEGHPAGTCFEMTIPDGYKYEN